MRCSNLVEYVVIVNLMLASLVCAQTVSLTISFENSESEELSCEIKDGLLLADFIGNFPGLVFAVDETKNIVSWWAPKQIASGVGIRGGVLRPAPEALEFKLRKSDLVSIGAYLNGRETSEDLLEISPKTKMGFRLIASNDRDQQVLVTVFKDRVHIGPLDDSLTTLRGVTFGDGSVLSAKEE